MSAGSTAARRGRCGGPGNAFVTFLGDSFIPTDACHWRGTLVEAGPSAADFATALAAQSGTVTTEPVAIEVSGHPALEMDFAVDPSIDPSACDDDRVCLFSTVDVACLRWYRSPEEHETFRVVEVGGQRLILSHGGFVELSDEDAAAARAVLDSVVIRAE